MKRSGGAGLGVHAKGKPSAMCPTHEMLRFRVEAHPNGQRSLATQLREREFGSSAVGPNLLPDWNACGASA